MLTPMSYVVIFITAFVLALVITPLSAKLGYRFKLTDRPGGRRAHQGEVPRTGGLALFAGFVGAGLLVFALSALGIWPPISAEDGKLLSGVLLGSVAVFAFGLWDDAHELSAWPQFVVQFGAALIAISFDIIVERVTLPIFGYTIFPPWLTYPLTIFWVMGMINTVNWLDGLDGLAGIITASAFAAYGVIAFLQGQFPLVQLCFILVGACFAFLWYNAHPAQLFMGDTGSQALGATLGTIAIMTGQWVLLPVIAIVPVAEVITVILQVGYFKYTGGQRLFRMAPLHHHFEIAGWTETQVVVRFWILGILCAFVALTTLKLR